MEPPLPPAVVIVGGIPSCEASVVCSLFVHHMLPNSNCHLHTQVLSSHGGRVAAVPRLGPRGSDPSAGSGIAATRMASASRGHLEYSFFDEGEQAANLNGARQEGSRKRSRPRH